MMYSFVDLGEKFLRCDTCKRIGKEGWAHVCGPTGRGNWYVSVHALRADLAKSRLPPGTIVRGTKP
jgi:hypothetical protein